MIIVVVQPPVQNSRRWEVMRFFRAINRDDVGTCGQRFLMISLCCDPTFGVGGGSDNDDDDDDE